MIYCKWIGTHCPTIVGEITLRIQKIKTHCKNFGVDHLYINFPKYPRYFFKSIISEKKKFQFFKQKKVIHDTKPTAISQNTKELWQTQS